MLVSPINLKNYDHFPGDRGNTETANMGTTVVVVWSRLVRALYDDGHFVVLTRSRRMLKSAHCCTQSVLLPTCRQRYMDARILRY